MDSLQTFQTYIDKLKFVLEQAQAVATVDSAMDPYTGNPVPQDQLWLLDCRAADSYAETNGSPDGVCNEARNDTWFGCGDGWGLYSKNE